MSHSKGPHGRYRWNIDFSDIRRGRQTDLAAPPGFLHNPPKEDESSESSDPALVTKMGWTLALGPWKQLPLNLFVLWMAGNSISLFPIMMVGMMFFRPVQTLFSYKEVFSKLTGEQAILQRLTYVLANLVGIGLALYKFNSMGLLPTSQSDWLEFMEAKQTLEIAGGGMILL